jgi:sec-independent protein translocase protein TatC
MTKVPDDIRMSLGDHIEELRRCLLRALLGLAVGIGVCLALGDQIMAIMCWPAAVVMRYRHMAVHLRVLAPAESFITYMEVTLIWGLILSAPFALWQLWRFIAAGLYPTERRLVSRYVPLSIGLFILGVAFFLLVMAPLCLNFFVGFTQSSFPTPTWANPLMPAAAPLAATAPAATQPAAPMHLPVLAVDPPQPREGDVWISAADGRVHVFLAGKTAILEAGSPSFLSSDLTLNNYISFVSRLSLMFGVGFQVPIAVFLLAGTRLVRLDVLRRSRKYVVLIVLIVAAVLTPGPDVVSQLALGLPMYLLFELGLVLAGRSLKARPSGQNLTDTL